MAFEYWIRPGYHCDSCPEPFCYYYCVDDAIHQYGLSEDPGGVPCEALCGACASACIWGGSAVLQLPLSPTHTVTAVNNINTVTGYGLKSNRADGSTVLDGDNGLFRSGEQHSFSFTNVNTTAQTVNIPFNQVYAEEPVIVTSLTGISAANIGHLYKSRGFSITLLSNVNGYYAADVRFSTTRGYAVIASASGLLYVTGVI